MLKDGLFTAEDDITQALPDGRTILLLAKGVSIPEAVARQAGFIKGEGVQGPTERKFGTPLTGQIVESGVPTGADVLRTIAVNTEAGTGKSGLANAPVIAANNASGLTVAGPNPDPASQTRAVSEQAVGTILGDSTLLSTRSLTADEQATAERVAAEQIANERATAERNAGVHVVNATDAHIQPDTSEPLATGSNATNPRARGANRRS